VEPEEVYKAEILAVFQDQAVTHLVVRKRTHLLTVVLPVAVTEV
jgi:hypothetical protein